MFAVQTTEKVRYGVVRLQTVKMAAQSVRNEHYRIL